jgi:hypothetical protein
VAEQNFILTHAVWKKITATNDSALVWLRDKGTEGQIFIARTSVINSDTIIVGSQEETNAGISKETAIVLKRDERLKIRANTNACCYYALFFDSRPETSDTATISVQNPVSPVDVMVSDQVTPFNDFYFLQAIGAPTTLTAATLVEDPPTTPGTIISVASVTNISIGNLLVIVSGISGEERFYIGEVIAINALDVTLDNPMDFAFQIGDSVVSTTRDLNVNGSITPQVFEIRAGGAGSTIQLDITRLIMQCLTDTPVDLSKFGDIAGGLTYGMLLRENNGRLLNKWNVKTNGDLAILAYDWDPTAASNPVQGQDGFKWRYTLAGQDKHGVAFRVGPNSTLQLIIQDDLTSIDLLHCIGANHEVIP